MRIPNVREDEHYNEKYLNSCDRQYLNGYDHAVEDVLESFFDNLDAYDFEVDGEDINLGRILENHEDILENFKEQLKLHFESERDEMVTSMIETMDDEEYDTIKEKVDSEDN